MHVKMKFNPSRITLAILLALGITAGDNMAKAEFNQNESILHRNETILRQKAITLRVAFGSPKVINLIILRLILKI